MIDEQRRFLVCYIAGKRVRGVGHVRFRDCFDYIENGNSQKGPNKKIVSVGAEK